ncbi:carbonic anhydrase [Crucibulum laeve]|uniref:Carbonic anhydrase n=1 Tax=Crucibulum laeve TaxID=68775 RepID=A0A5C3MKK6_9AGAR|nr:carbonic anhydrase [Crucibulum laeve]
MLSTKLLILLLTVSLGCSHPIAQRANTKPSSTSSSVTSTTTSKPTSTSSIKSSSTSSGKPSSTTSAATSTAASVSATPSASASLNAPSNFNTLNSLFEGNKKFRAGNKTAFDKLITQQPSFMFLGCSDNRLSPGAIFQAPVGSIVSQTSIGNQYSGKDASADAAVSYAVDNLGVKHVIVLGHYGCKGVAAAIDSSSKPSSAVKKWVKPIAEMFAKSNRAEIKKLRDSRKPKRGKKNEAPPALKADDPGFRALVEENVKTSVKRLQTESFLSQKSDKKSDKKTQHKDYDVYVHGLVYDELSGEVSDLRVSFGPPGKKIPAVPFVALAAAKNQHQPKWAPGFFKGKKLTKQ